MPKVLTSNGVTIFDDVKGEHAKFFRGDEVPDHLVAKMSDFHFKSVAAEPDKPEFYEDMRVAQLVELCRERELTPTSNNKKDLISALAAADEGA